MGTWCWPEPILHHHEVETWTDIVQHWHWATRPSLRIEKVDSRPRAQAKDGVFPPSSGQQDVFDKAGIGWGSDVTEYLVYLPGDESLTACETARNDGFEAY